MSTPRQKGIAAVAAIADPHRRALFDAVAGSDHPVSRDEAAAASGLPRSTVAFHLDRLVEEGLLQVEFQRLSGRTGPGAGRPAKLYRAAETELAVSIPERRYDLAGELLAASVDEADRTGEPVRRVLLRQAHEHGQTLAASAESLDALLTATGYEPRDDGEGGTVLANCPFHRLAAKHSEVICQANLALVSGAAEALGEDRGVEFVPPTGRSCCVRIAGAPCGAPGGDAAAASSD